MDPRGLVPSGSAEQQILQQQALHQQALHRQAMQQHQQQPPPGQPQVQGLAGNLYRHGNMQQAGYQQSQMNGLGSSSQSQPVVRGTREGGFADLNAEPPASDGEADGPVPSDSNPSAAAMAQHECARATPPDEKRRRTKTMKEGTVGKEGEDTKKGSKPAKSRGKSRGDTLESGVDGDTDAHVTGIPKTREEKLKSLKAGLMHVARKLPKNAHAQFFLGLMLQRLGQSAKAAASFEKAAEILKQTEEDAGQGRTQFLALVQIHQAQCLLQSNLMTQLGSTGSGLRQDELEGVINKVREGAQTNHGQAAIWNTLGLILLHTGRVQSAMAVFQSLLGVVPDCMDALANLGVAYMQCGHFQNATRCFQAVLEKNKTHPGALMNYGALLIQQYGSSFAGAGAGSGGYKGVYSMRHTAAIAAQQCLESALKDDPKAGYMWVNLAAAYSASGSIWDANRCLEQASKLEPARMSTRYAVASHRLRDAERLDDATEQSDQLGWAANEMASILRDVDTGTVQPRLAWAGLAMVNRAQHETAASFEGGGVDLKEVEDRAIHSLQQVIEEDPQNAVPWHQLGLHALCTLQFGAAQKYLKSAIARRHNCLASWSNLGIALHFSEDLSVAERVYKQALALAGPDQVHSVLSNLGNLYRQQKRFDDAHAVYKKALELCPDYAPASNNLGLLYVAEGNWDLAIASFDRALAADPYFEAARSNKMKAEVLAHNGKGCPAASGPCCSPDAAPPQADTSSPSDSSGMHLGQPTPPQSCSSEPVQSFQSSPHPVQFSQPLPESPQPVPSCQLPQPIQQVARHSQPSFLQDDSSSQPPLPTFPASPPVAARVPIPRQSPQMEPFRLPSTS